MRKMSVGLRREGLASLGLSLLVYGIILSLAPMAEGQALLDTIPFWTSTPTGNTYCVAWGDMDGNGDLDLACGNNGANTVYLNTGTTLNSTPSWSSALAGFTYSAAWGDVDDDGDLDLACGNLAGANTVYFNTGSTLEASPSWVSSLTNMTSSVAWGDVDDDGDLDLACTNMGQRNTLYLNTGSTLQTSPSWISTPQNNTSSVAWGDVDADGSLDLVCGNAGGVNTLYLNRGTMLDTLPSWSSNPHNNTYSVALDDVDGDGDLDLVCGNTGGPNTLYLNLGTMLDTLPSWSSSAANATNSVAWGDVDGDGTLDIGCGNIGQKNTLYLNRGTMLDTLPSWSSNPQNFTYGVAWGDVDGDGDLDLACGNMGQANTLYLNTSDQMPPDVTVIAPNGGESWIIGDMEVIIWGAIDNVGVDSVNIYCSTDNGASWDTVATGEPNDSTFPWTVPYTPSDSCLVKVAAFDPSLNVGEDVSDSVFTIYDPVPPEVTIVRPNGGERWRVGDTEAILWIATDNVRVDSLSIFYSTDGGGSWDTVSTGEQNDSTYLWMIPATPSDSCLVRVIAYDPSLGTDEDVSDSLFTILPVGIEELTDHQLSTINYQLSQNHPNPFVHATTITYLVAGSRWQVAGKRQLQTDNSQRIKLAVYDLSGRLMRTLVDEERTPGYYSVCWDGTDDDGLKVPSGVYLYGLCGRKDGPPKGRRTSGQARPFTATRKLTILR